MQIEKEKFVAGPRNSGQLFSLRTILKTWSFSSLISGSSRKGFRLMWPLLENKNSPGENGYFFENVDLTFAEVNPDDYDLLVLPGGIPDGAPTTVRKNKNAQNIAKAFFAKANKPVAAICHGPYTLVSADVIKGRHLTGYWYDGVPEEIKAAGGHYVDKEVVVDGNLVTSRWPADLPAFMRETMKMIKRYQK